MNEKGGKVLTVVLMGKIDQGKSSTANTLLGASERYFQEGCDSMVKAVKCIKDYSTQYEGHKWRVYDTSGLMDVNYGDTFQTVTNWHEEINRLMQICEDRKEYIDAFLIVHSAVNKFSREDKEIINIIEATFGGEKFLKMFGILVLTREDNLGENYEDWIQRQCGELQNTIKKCNDRVVIVCNKDIENKRIDSRKRLMSVISKLKADNNNTSYTYNQYMNSQLERRRLLLSHEINKINEEYETRIRDIRDGCRKVKTRSDREKVIKEIAILKVEISDKDAETGKLEYLVRRLDKIEKYLTVEPCCVQ